MTFDTAAEVGIAGAVQLGTLLWFLSGLKSDLRNLTGWVRNVAKSADDTALEHAELKGRVESLPCVHCSPKAR